MGSFTGAEGVGSGLGDVLVNCISVSNCFGAHWRLYGCQVDLHGGADLLHGLLCAGTGADCALVKYLHDLRLGKAGASYLDGLEDLHQGVRGPALALDAADARGTAALVDFGEGFRG